MYFQKYDNSKAEIEIYKDIRDLITQLKKADSNNKFDKIAADLKMLYDLTERHNLYDYPNVDNYVSRKIDTYENDNLYNIFVKKMNRLLSIIQDDLDFYQEYALNYELFKYYKFEKDYHELEYVKDKEIFEYAKEFMSYFDKDLYNAYKTLEDHNHILLNDYDKTELGGLFTPLNNNKLSYLSLYLNNNIDDASSIVHETAHLRQHDFLKNSKANNSYNYLYREVYSYFIQFVFYDYLKNKNLFKRDIDTCFNGCLENLNNTFVNLNYDLDHLDSDYLALYSDLQYAFGIHIALKYYDIYINDPEYAMFLTNSFIEDSYNYAPLDVLNNFGLDKDDILNGEILIKYLKK